MNPQPHGFDDLRDRVLKLEKQNRRFKQLGVAALIVAASFAVMGQTPSKKTVEANEFVLRDSNGSIRAKLSVRDDVGGMPQMVLLDAKGYASLELDGALPGLTGGSAGVADEQGHRVGTFLANNFGGAFWIAKGKSGVSLTQGAVDITDDEGFQTTVGTENLVTPKTGETHKTSAASVVLFDKDKNVIWKAP